MIDLHGHSIHSDGADDPEELPALCEKNGVEVFALCDHDTTEGTDSAKEAFKGSSVNFVSGIEISCIKGVHLLGYGIDHKNETLVRKLAHIKRMYKDRAKKIVEILVTNGFVVDHLVLHKCFGVITTLEVFRAIQSMPNGFNYSKNSQKSFSEFSKRWIYKNSPYYELLKIERMTFKEAIDLIHKAGGIAAWAHPAHTLRNRINMMDDMGDELKKLGLDGIEVFSSKHNKEQTTRVLKLNDRLDLVPTAGSDFHGYGAQELGGYELYELEFNSKRIIELIEGKSNIHF